MSVWAANCAILFDEMKALELMKTHVATTSPHSTLAHAVDLMDLYQVSVLPVIDGAGRICGTVTESDIFEAICASLDAPSRATPDRSATDGSAHDGTGIVQSQPALDRDLARIAVQATEPLGVAGAAVERYMTTPAVTVPEDRDLTEVLPLLFDATCPCVFVLDGVGRVVGRLSRIDLFQALFEGTLNGLASA